MPLFSTADVWTVLLFGIVALVGMCIGLCLHEQYAIRKADRELAAKVAQQERRDVAGRKANADEVVWR